jgi:hypothetical protein
MGYILLIWMAELWYFEFYAAHTCALVVGGLEVDGGEVVHFVL